MWEVYWVFADRCFTGILTSNKEICRKFTGCLLTDVSLES